MQENNIKTIFEKITSKKFPNVLIENFQAVRIHEFCEETKQWTSKDDFCIYIIVSNNGRNDIINLYEIENELSILTGFEVSVSR